MTDTDLVTIEQITKKIYLIRDMKVMLDRDLAFLYSVDTSALKRNVRRNLNRFPSDFMFELTEQEIKYLKGKFADSGSYKMNLKYPPMAFTEQGVAMLSSVLRSDRAIQVNIQIMRTFTKIQRHDTLTSGSSGLLI